MESELVALFEAAKKAADAATVEDDAVSESRCLDALKELKSFPVNYQILVSTQVGKQLRHLTKHPKTKIQSFAADLIEIWKNIIINETAQKKNGSSISKESVKAEDLSAANAKKHIPVKVEKSMKSETIKVEKVEKVVSPRPQKLAKTETGSVVRKLESNSYKTEHPSIPEPVKVERTVNIPKLPEMVKTQDPVRNKMREILLEALSKVIGEADDSMKTDIEACDPIRVAVTVESVMFENWGRSTGAHKFKYRSILFNIKDQNNPDFRRKVLLGEIKPERICNLTTEDMASEQRRQQNKEIEEKKLFDCERSGAPKATTDQFKCGRCGQRKCTYYQLQTRSADEPMTTFVTCVNCNNHWKFC
ncbi:hypothetical protein RND81_04G053800 [Saponaria officinalis]|uniref:Transcription elongation factor n=2 Tax=Saponaria officinalis TaxID=3572 RepID=A0AAW1LJR0_SAPOF